MSCFLRILFQNYVSEDHFVGVVNVKTPLSRDVTTEILKGLERSPLVAIFPSTYIPKDTFRNRKFDVMILFFGSTDLFVSIVSSTIIHS